MVDRMASLSDEAASHVAEIAKELSVYGLGIAFPHMHVGDAIVELPPHLVQCEMELKVSFVAKDQVPESTFPVGWRWLDGKLVAWANCCGNTPPPPSSK